MCSGFKPKARFYWLLGLKNRHFYAVPGTAGKSSSADKPRGSAEALENSRISLGSLPWISATTTDSTNVGQGNIRWSKGDTAKGSIKKDPTGTMYDPQINLSWSNSLFGASETVQPAGMFGLYLVRAYQA